MDPGVRSPLVDFFRRGEVARDIRLLAARGAFAPRALEQLAILLILLDDADPDIASSAQATVDALPQAALGAFLARTDVPGDMRDWFAARGVTPTPGTPASDDPLVDSTASESPSDAPGDESPDEKGGDK